MIAPTLLTARSRGWVRLGSPDPAAAPRILTNALEHPDDVRSMIAGMRLAQRIAGTDPLRAKVVKALKPGDDLDSDADFHDHLRSRVELIYHPVGTCRIGKDEDAVVDPELRVHGMRGLRVCDASVFPVIPGGNTNAPVIAVAERAADLIKAGAGVSA